MNKTPRLSNTKIEYLDKVWNFTSGCLKGCTYCYARPITKRFTNHYPSGFKPTLYPEALLSPLHLKKPSRIGVCFMGDLFTDCPEFNPDREIHTLMPSGRASITMFLLGWIFTTIRECPQHTFVFLTKQPQNLIKFSPFPDNCFVGVTATDFLALQPAVYNMSKVSARVKYISAEPLLAPYPKVEKTVEMLLGGGINWIIIGAQTKPTVMPKIEWVKEIVEAADKAGVKVFLKDNLKPLLEWPRDIWGYNSFGNHLRQEMPK